ncbi:MAG: hypothetical protein A3D95_05280 [Betaproteobacteria bacterium RIFCSPHIGHO2_12_FULL_69_13]|nr:MAG: hypothetical protein A3D95_05280 [Betaproteobacteria bacterium RIFCSPHIGHO2_12_FULL_69_13]OGA67588.1 MAG: hypothetical protein A3G83_03900 [Betaproteobacteria bacterium RIFCSPLOWO2_12_FULL_68_20]
MHRIVNAALLCVLGAAPFAVAAQPAPSPYAGEQSREIKALSAQEVDDYLAGRGMGFARAAELNRYPGPLHVLELADRLALSADQKARTQTLRGEVQSRASVLGKALIEREAALDRLFASRSISRERLKSRLEDIAKVQGELRRVHLEAHLAQTEILTHAQIAQYAELRGYGGAGPAAHDAGSHTH